jgi:putative FmdB family regulatory protein
MPMYQYRCDKCGKELEEFHKVDDRYEQKCPACGEKMQIVIQPSPIHIFEPFFHPNLTTKPVYVKSKEHLKQLDKKYNMTSYY